MIKKKTTILFDLDGTLFDSIPTILKSFRETFQKIEEKIPEDREIKKYIGSDLRHILRNFLAEEKIELARRTYRDAYLSKQNQGIIQLFPGIQETLEYLKEQNFNLGIVTSKKRIHSISLLQNNQIEGLFDIVIGCEDVENCKPHPEPLLKALKKINSNLSNSVYVGDALIDMQAANNAAMDFIAVTTGTTSQQSFEKNGQKIILPSLISLKKYF